MQWLGPLFLCLFFSFQKYFFFCTEFNIWNRFSHHTVVGIFVNFSPAEYLYSKTGGYLWFQLEKLPSSFSFTITGGLTCQIIYIFSFWPWSNFLLNAQGQTYYNTRLLKRVWATSKIRLVNDIICFASFPLFCSF